MPLFVLRTKENLNWDCVWGFVIRTDSEEEARNIAQKVGGDETRRAIIDEVNGGVTHEEISFWTDSSKTSCKKLDQEGEEKIIMKDWRSG